VGRDAVFVVQPGGKLRDLIRVDVYGQGVVLRLEPRLLFASPKLMPVPSPDDDQLVEPSNATMPSSTPPLV